MKIVLSLSLVACALLTPTAFGQLPAFPGAEGFGRFATGGRGGTVYHVTNLNDSGPGSFRDAVSVSGRTVVFDVGGVIDYQSPRYAPKSNITIAGQTAPGDGVVLYGNGLSFSGSHNNICRFIRVRQGINGDSGADAIGIANGHDMIFDHLSVSWGRDETFSVNGNVTNITIQSSIISQGLQTHSAGGLIQTPGGVSILRSLYIDNDTRNPKVKFINEFVNNVVCNWEAIGYNMGGGSSSDSYANVFNNYFIRGPQSSSSAFGGGNSNFHIYATNNWHDSNQNGLLDGSEMSIPSYGPMDLQTTPYAYPITSAVSPLTALKLAISDVGVSHMRDQVDELLLAELTSWGTLGGTISSELDLPTGGPGVVRNGTPYPDTDQDGMPDYWENGTGSNANVPNNNDPSPSGSGYTRLEDYLNWLAKPHGVALTDTTVAVDLRQFLRGFEDVSQNPVYSVNNPSNGSVSLVASVIGRFTPTTALNGTAAFEFTVTDDDGSMITRTMNLFFTPSAQAYEPVWHGDDFSNNWDVAGDNNWFDGQSLLYQFQNGDAVTFDDTGSTNPSVNCMGSLQPSSVSFDATQPYSLAGSGSLDGGMNLDKTGTGTLRVNTVNNFTGATTVSNGVLLVNGGLANSAVTVRNGGAGGGSGFLGNGLNAQSGSVVIPGDGLGVAGTLSITNGFVENGGVTNRFDLSDDPTGATKTNDQIQVVGDLTLSGVNTIKISLLDGLAGDGVYTLITYTGNLNGSLANLALAGVNGTLTNPPNAIAIIVSSVRPPANLVWSGNGGSTWETGVSVNWLNDSVPDRFYFLDTVRFDDSGSAAAPVSLSGALTPNSVTVDAVQNFTFSGGGNITGTGGLAKTNTGTLTVLTVNDYTGPTVIGGGVLSVSTLGNGGVPSGIGASSSSAANLVFQGGSLRYTGGSLSMNRNATFVGEGGVEIANGGTTLTANGTFTGSGSFSKSGAGTLSITAANTHSGGTSLRAGMISLVNTTARDSGLGSGTLTFDGGTLKLYGNGGSTGNDYGTFNHPLAVPAGQTGTLLTPPRYTLGSSLTGAGTLNLEVDYVRGRLSGNWVGFTGLVNVTARSNPSEMRIANATMFNNASVFLNNNVLMVRNGGSSTVNIGALGGATGSTVGKGNSTSSGTTYKIGWNNADATFAGSFENDGTTTVTKEGAGIWTLTAANSWSGGLTINGGTVRANNVSGSGTGSGSVVVNSGGAFGGTGSVSGVVAVNSGGVIDPGASVGTLNINNSLTLNAGAVSRFELGAVNASDRVAVSGSVVLGGSLTMTNLPGFDAGTYTLFTYGGSRSGSLSIGAMPAGYAGAINTAVSGQVRLIVTVSAEPVIDGVSRNGDNIELSGSGGTANGTYYLLSSTDLTVPMSSWDRVSTNEFDALGNFSVAYAIDAGTPEQFFSVEIP